MAASIVRDVVLSRVAREIRCYGALWPVPLLAKIHTLKLLTMATETAARSCDMPAAFEACRVVGNRRREMMSDRAIRQLNFAEQINRGKAEWDRRRNTTCNHEQPTHTALPLIAT